MQRLPRSGLLLATHLVNLDRAPGRRAAMEARLHAAGLAHERVPAVDGALLAFPHPDFSEAAYRLLHGRRTLPAEVGCYLSHVACARRFLAGPADLLLVVEDDVSFEPGFLDALDRAALRRDRWDLLRLSTMSSGRALPMAPLGGGLHLGVALTREKGSGAYLVNRRAAAWIAGMVPMRLPFDLAFDLEFLRGLKAAFLLPSVASQRDDAPSQIQHALRRYRLGRWRYVTILPFRTLAEAARLLCRGARLIQGRLAPAAGARAPAPGAPTGPRARPPS